MTKMMVVTGDFIVFLAPVKIMTQKVPHTIVCSLLFSTCLVFFMC